MAGLPGRVSFTAPAGDIAIVDFILSVAGSQESCLSFHANGQLKGLNVSLVFQSRGSQESWPRDMFILMRLLDPQTGAIVACYQFGGYDYSVNKLIVYNLNYAINIALILL